MMARSLVLSTGSVDAVAPLAGAWIETISRQIRAVSWYVAPLAGAWIETMRIPAVLVLLTGRAPRGRVD